MSRFLRLFLVWSVFAFLGAVALDIIISTGLRKADLRKYAVWNDIYNGNAGADLLIIGSSRAWCGYSTIVIDSLLHCNSYNLGFDGHPLDFQLIRYETYRRFNPKPHVILLNTDFLSTLGSSADFQYEREQFFPYIDDRELIRQVQDVKRISFWERFFPLLRYYGYREDVENGVRSFLGKKTFFDGGMHKGYRGNEYAFSRGMALDADTTFFIRSDDEAVSELRSFVSHACEEGVKVYFIKSPVYAPLIEMFGNVAETDSLFAEIAKEYHVPVLDYYRASFCNDSAFFSNPSHLNKKGAEYFSRRLCEDLLESGICSELE